MKNILLVDFGGTNMRYAFSESGSSKVNDEIYGKVKILKKTKTLVFLFCELNCNGKIITSASGIWKILKIKTTD